MKRCIMAAGGALTLVLLMHSIVVCDISAAQDDEDDARGVWLLSGTEESTSEYGDTGCWPEHSVSIGDDSSATTVATSAAWDSSCADGTCRGTVRSSSRWNDPDEVLVPGTVMNISASYELSARQTCGAKTFDTSVRIYVHHDGLRETLPGGPSILGWSSDTPSAKGFGTAFWQVPAGDPGERMGIEVMGGGPGGTASRLYNYTFFAN